MGGNGANLAVALRGPAAGPGWAGLFPRPLSAEAAGDRSSPGRTRPRTVSATGPAGRELAPRRDNLTIGFRAAPGPGGQPRGPALTRGYPHPEADSGGRERVEQATDIVVIGGGIAGASAAARLAPMQRVIVLEREPVLGYHTTGRSAAFFTETYGNAVIRALTRASRSFFEQPEAHFEAPLLTGEGGSLFLARADQTASFAREFRTARALDPSIVELSPEEAVRRVPVLRPGYVARAFLEPAGREMDVDRIHQGWLRALRAHGGQLVCNAGVRAIRRRGGQWEVDTPRGVFRAPVLVNAAGAWCDVIGRLAGCRPIGLVPKRRTAIVFSAPAAINPDGWPVTLDIDEEFYFRPDAGRILASPADETDSPPCDAQPEELDIAITAERIQRATTLTIGRIESRWAGLRSFVADRTLVIGADPGQPGFFWLAGQGGYGIMTSPAAAAACAALVTGGAWPPELAAEGLEPGALAVTRGLAVPPD